ncbi:hypothetical protein KR074_008561 [Drosophila pseudoananassae]|nr:hypothetical protein KR074_008561 [Drosophila pseudoananassae]
MIELKVLLFYNLLLIWIVLGDCSVSVPVLKNNELIEAQSLARIVNRPINKLGPEEVHGNDITRSSNIDRGYPSIAPQVGVSEEPKINEIPPLVTSNGQATYTSSQSTHSSQLSVQMQSPLVTQHIHYHYLVPNVPSSSPINYVSQSAPNAHNEKTQNTYSPTFDSTHRNVLYGNEGQSPVYRPTKTNGYSSDPPDEYQVQASENNSVYAPVASHQGELPKGEDQRRVEAAPIQTNPPEVYFIQYKGNKDPMSTSTPLPYNHKESSDATFDGSGLIDIRSGKDENTTNSPIEDAESSSARVYSAYDVPLC